MTPRNALLLAFATALAASAASGVAAQRTTSPWDSAVDLKPLVLPPVRPFLPPNSVLTPGSMSSGSSTSYPTGPTFDSGSAPAPGLKLTIPTR